MSEEEYEDYLQFLRSIEEDDEDRKELDRLGLTDPGPVDVSGYNSE